MYASMEKTDRETHDFMNVESFSQLPFIRSAPPSAKERTAGGSGGGGGAIRLFGKEFINNSNNNDDNNNNDDDYSTNNNANKEISNRDNNNNNNKSSATTEISSSSSSRKFECHYCCRNFPTSQALGGHQNAHKRERQQAKRAHLQSAMAHGAAAGLADAAHVYGLMSYGPRLGSIPAPMTYHSRLYGGSYHQPQAINGSPLALWRIPAAGGPPQYGSPRLGSMHRQMELKPQPLTSISGGNSASQIIRFGYEAKNEMHDHVSLDLRL